MHLRRAVAPEGAAVTMTKTMLDPCVTCGDGYGSGDDRRCLACRRANRGSTSDERDGQARSTEELIEDAARECWTPPIRALAHRARELEDRLKSRAAVAAKLDFKKSRRS